MPQAEHNAPSVVPVSEHTLGAPAKRRYGRGVGLILGLLLIALPFVPRPFAYLVPSGYPGVGGFDGEMGEDIDWEVEADWVWGWLDTDGSPIPFPNVWPLFLPGVFGVAAITGSLQRHPRRGVILLVAGLGLLFVPFVIEELMSGQISGARSFNPMTTAMVGLLWIVASVLMVGGHGAQWRGGWVRRRRWAAAGPGILSIGLAVGLSAYFILRWGFITAWYTLLETLRLALRGIGVTGPVLTLCQVSSLGLVGISLIIAPGNLIIRSRRAAGLGYWSGIAGVFVLICLTIADVRQGSLAVLLSLGEPPLLACWVEMILQWLPVFAAIALIITGYGSLWLGDPPKKADAVT